MRDGKVIAIAAGLLAGVVAPGAGAHPFYEFPTPVTPIAKETLFIHNLFLTIMLALFIPSAAIVLYSLYAHRKSRGHVAATFTRPTTRKQWVLVSLPFVALVFIDYVVLGIPAFHSILAIADTSNPALTVKVTASQWKWQYDYPSYGIKFTSSLSTPQDEIDDQAPPDEHFLREVDHPLVLPTNEKVDLVIASDDVIHSFWVPAFGIKQDAVPGSLRETWVKIDKPGTYRGQCAELCGVGHAFMPIVVVAKTPADFARWVRTEQAEADETRAAASQTFTMAQLMSRGQGVYDKICAACHQPTGLGIPGAFPPIAGGHPFAASPALIANLVERGFYRNGRIVVGPVANHIDLVLHGIPGSPMPAFESQLSAVDIAAVITFERNSFGNHTGETVQPADVAHAEHGQKLAALHP